jgi:ribonuclease BN (tRNA processing enzyme)
MRLRAFPHLSSAHIPLALLCAAVVAFSTSSGDAQVSPVVADKSPREPFVVFLGTGVPAPTPDRQGPSLAVIAGGKAYLVDVGVGVVRQANAAYRQGIGALEPRDLSIAFITHLHSDHTIGLPDLILTPWVIGRKSPLELYGPAGIRSMADNILKAYGQDIEIRTTGLEQGNTTGYKVHAHEITPGVVYQDSAVKVTAFAVRHGSWPLALGYRFDAGGKSIVVSGDTAPAESVVENCNGCDLLIHEVYLGLPPDATGSTEKWARYMKAFHTSAPELADIATRAHAKSLAATHLIGDPVALAEALQKGYPGKIVIARDLDVVSP